MGSMYAAFHKGSLEQRLFTGNGRRSSDDIVLYGGFPALAASPGSLYSAKVPAMPMPKAYGTTGSLGMRKRFPSEHFQQRFFSRRQGVLHKTSPDQIPAMRCLTEEEAEKDPVNRNAGKRAFVQPAVFHRLEGGEPLTPVFFRPAVRPADFFCCVKVCFIDVHWSAKIDEPDFQSCPVSVIMEEGIKRKERQI